MTRGEREQIQRIRAAVERAWDALQQLEEDRESLIGTALLRQALEEARRGLGALGDDNAVQRHNA